MAVGVDDVEPAGVNSAEVETEVQLFFGGPGSASRYVGARLAAGVLRGVAGSFTDCGKLYQFAGSDLSESMNSFQIF